ncbi:amino acid transporter [Sorangium cellulosum]|uniref:Amino acid transporter n=1 Tax=Sorangium cellulosum TaxID=56 RepID=A0A150SFF1_SORCE|nr:amino acid transporter [Sorangium cellulosum]
MSLRAILFGRRLASDEEEKEQIGPLSGIPVLGLDALASASYGPEAALTVLIPLGALGLRYIVPLSALVIALLVIVYVSYRQTIVAYPSGGGSYIVAKENLGTNAGLVAAAALLLDYVLNVAVAVSAGVGALVSAVPALLPHTLGLCLAVLVLLTAANLRGLRTAGLVFMAPTYAFLGCLFAVIAIGIGKMVLQGGHPAPVVAPPSLPSSLGTASIALLCHAFASGCTAMTGVEAVSNGVPAFRKPSSLQARRTLSYIVASLGILLAGIAILAQAYGVTATEPGKSGYQSIISQVVGAVVGRGPFYYVTLTAVVAVLMLSANTSFADFPRLCQLLAIDRFLPEPFIHRGRRLAFSYGIAVLTGLSALLLIVFQGITDALIPLFAVGAFLAFTMSQAGMVAHWNRVRGPRSRLHLAINATGATATAATLVVIILSKFTEGAWVSTLLVIAAFFLFRGVKRHYAQLEDAVRDHEPLDLTPPPPPIVVVPVRRWDLVAQKGLRFALQLSPEVYALQVLLDDPRVEDLSGEWHDLVEEPAKAKGVPAPRLVVVRSRYRRLFRPLLRFITTIARAHPERQVAVVVPEVVESRWYHYLLHNHTASILKWLLLFRGGKSVVIVNTPFYLYDTPKTA